VGLYTHRSARATSFWQAAKLSHAPRVDAGVAVGRDDFPGVQVKAGQQHQAGVEELRIIVEEAEDTGK